LAAGASAASSSLLTGVHVARNAIDVVLRGSLASIDLRGLDLPTGTQRHDTAVTVEHAASHGSSRQLFKAAVDDRARGSFSGRVIVQPGTVGNDADQTSRSLLLAPTAQADSRPWLEIFSDDVRCTHGSSTGRLDDEALFYLRSRGIPLTHARTMLVGGFVAEMTESIEPPTLRALVESAARRPRGDEVRT
jgi:Fe-S cluster assembly protein SufD